LRVAASSIATPSPNRRASTLCAIALAPRPNAETADRIGAISSGSPIRHAADDACASTAAAGISTRMHLAPSAARKSETSGASPSTTLWRALSSIRTRQPCCSTAARMASRASGDKYCPEYGLGSATMIRSVCAPTRWANSAGLNSHSVGRIATVRAMPPTRRTTSTTCGGVGSRMATCRPGDTSPRTAAVHATNGSATTAIPAL